MEKKWGKNVFIIIDICFFMCLMIMNFSRQNNTTLVSILVVLFFIYMTLIEKYIIKYIFTVNYCFLCFFCICLFSQIVFRDVFHYDFHNTTYLIQYLKDQNLNKAALLSLQSLVALHIGSLCFSEKKSYEKNINNSIELNSLNFLGKLFFIVCMVPAIYVLLVRLSAMNTGGYSAMFDSKEKGFMSIPGKLSVYFNLSWFMLLATMKKKKIFFAGIFYFGIQLLMGARGIPLITLIMYIMLYHYTVKKLKLKHFIIIIVLASIGSVFLVAMKTLRQYNLSEWGIRFWDNSEEIMKKNPVIEIFLELGTAIVPTSYAVKLVPNTIAYKYGFTYIAAGLLMIPDVFGIIRTQFVMDSAQLANYVASFAGMPFGGSLVEEAYVNFGMLAPFIFIFFGYYIRKLSDKCRYSSKLSFTVFGMFASIYIIWSVRNTSNDAFQNISYYILLPYIVYNIIKRKIYKKTKL